MDTVVVYTSKDTEMLFEQGGSGDWKANEARLEKCSYLVAVANAHSNWSKHLEDRHKHAFLVGKVSGVKDAPATPGRLIIKFSQYALIDVPNSWDRQRNPVRYTNLSEFDLNTEELDWQDFPTDQVQEVDSTSPLTVNEAKNGLAKHLGISPDCIEITIRA